VRAVALAEAGDSSRTQARAERIPQTPDVVADIIRFQR
jgi:hypothetical protein